MSEFVLKVSKKADAPLKATTGGVKDSNLPNADDGYVATKWRQERIWIEAVEKESKAIQEWTEKWSFLTEYDQKGNLKLKEEIPEKVSLFSDKAPSSSGQIYGHRLLTEEAKQMAQMEQNLSANYRKRRNKDLICYD